MDQIFWRIILNVDSTYCDSAYFHSTTFSMQVIISNHTRLYKVIATFLCKLLRLLMTSFSTSNHLIGKARQALFPFIHNFIWIGFLLFPTSFYILICKDIWLLSVSFLMTFFFILRLFAPITLSQKLKVKERKTLWYVRITWTFFHIVREDLTIFIFKHEDNIMWCFSTDDLIAFKCNPMPQD